MLSRLPSADESARWSRRRYTYWTRHPVNSDYAELWRLNHDSEGGSTTDSESSSMFFDISQQDVSTGYLDVGLTLVSPDEDLLAYSVDTDGRRGLRAPLPRPPHRRRTCPTPWPAATTAAPGAPTRSGSSTPCTTRPTGPGRCCRHRLGTDPADDVVVLEEHDARFELNVRATRSGRPDRDLEREPLDQRGVGARRRRARVGAALGRRPAARRASTASSTHRRPAGDRMLVVTNDGAVEFRLMTAPVPARRRPGRVVVGGGAARARGRAALRRPTRSPTASSSPTDPVARTGCGSSRHDDLAGAGTRADAAATTSAASTSPATSCTTRRP